MVFLASKMTNKLHNMRFKHTNIDEDLYYRDQIANNNEEYVNDFLGNYSKPILEYVGEKILNVTPVELYSFKNKSYYKDYATPILSEFFLFIAAKFLDLTNPDGSPNKTPQWDALRSYSAKNNCSFYSYVNQITIRYFCKKTSNKKEPISNDKAFDYFANLFYDQDIPYDDLSEEIKNDLRSVLYDMKNAEKSDKSDGEKDSRILELSIMYDYEWYDVAEEMAEYFNYPIPDQLKDLPKNEKQKIQTRIAQWKKRAIEHLSSKVIKDKDDKYKHLKSAILQHKINRKTHKV